MGTPCTFLAAGRCSIYEHRPISCRLQINVDVDDLLCRLVPGEAITVPYLDTRTEKVASLLILGANARIADIRDWFPTLA